MSRVPGASTVAVVIAVLLLMLAVVGCGTDGAGTESGPGEGTSNESAPGAGSPTPATQAPAAAADGSDVQACFDGTCEIAVSEPVTVPLDARFSIDTVATEEIDSGKVTFRAESSGGVTRITVGPGGTATLNEISIQVKSVSDGTAVLAFSS